MSVDLTPVVTATTHWLVHAYPAGSGGVLSTVLAETQARQAVTLAAWLRYPTSMDAELMGMGGPGGTARLDGLLGTEALASQDDTEEPAWRSWVDEVLASWAVCLLTAPTLARTASERAAKSEHAHGIPTEFDRLITPATNDLAATPLLRHPDLTAPIADLHRGELLTLLDRDDDDDLREDASAPVI